MTAISVRTLTQTVLDHLEATVANATGFVSEAGQVPEIAGSDRRAAPYWVLHPLLGAEDPELDLGDSIDAVLWQIQVTCAAGYPTDLQALVDRVHAALYRWEPTITGLVCGPFRPPAGYAAPFLLDRDVTPHRPYCPLQYQSPITAA